MSRIKKWAVLWLEYERIGSVEEFTLFGLTLYRRSGSLVSLLGFHWVQK